jgi:hypothetical protein
MASRKLSLHLAPHVFELLQAKAQREGRSSANLAAFLVERELRSPHNIPAGSSPGDGTSSN